MVLAASGASATPTIPTVLQTKFKLATAPGCELCHLNGVGAASTATTPFALAVKAHGAKANDEAAFLAAFTAMQTEMTDSDGDGQSDIDELIAGCNPNVTGCTADAGDALPPPRYGCGANSAPQGPLAWSALLAAAGLVAVARWGRTRRPRP